MAKPKRKTRISRGGRPRKEGERYPSGDLKPQGPNPIVVEHRKALCDDITKATCPIDVMLANRWISMDDHRNAVRYRRDHDQARLQGPNVPVQKDQSVAQGADARDLRFTNLTHKEIADIWDSAMRPSRGGPSDQGQKEAMRRWVAAGDALTQEQRDELHNVVLLDSWPQWVLQRRAGRMNTSWERKFDLLMAALASLRRHYDGPRGKMQQAA